MTRSIDDASYQPVPLDHVERIPQVPLTFETRSEDDMRARARRFHEEMSLRRTVRDFAPDPVDEAIIRECIATANTAPSGANKQPWHFGVITSAEIKRQVREAAEDEERQFYAGLHGVDWVEEVAKLGTSWEKPFLEIAPYLIVVFRQSYGLTKDGLKEKHYYVPESCGLAAGLLIAALHNAGLATLTHTPNPMGFLRDTLGRPGHEKAIMIVVTGYPAAHATVPQISKKPFDELVTFY
ncbi:MAG: nitroreductase family protein [Pseudomonadota bacterium]